MPTTVLIRCKQCGYDNDARHRFCGMCGARLPAPQAVAPQPQLPARQEPLRQESPKQESPRTETPPPSSALSAPSVLGLSDEPVRDASYLLEDEEKTTHWGRIFVMLLFIAVGVSAWHWRQDLGTWAVRLSRDSAVAPAQVTKPAAPAASQPPGAAPPAAEQNQAGVAPAPAPPANTPAAGNPPAAGNARPSGGAASPTQGQASAPTQIQPQPDAKSAEATPGEPSSPPASAPVASKPSPAAQVVPASSPTGEGLEAEGEKYLYGSGVPANCDRARKDLLDAAAQSNAKAQSVIGTMYATGHCVPRDPALAYHWFAKALHQDPGNTRFARDLEVLWNQMSPEERQMAMRTGQ